MAITIGLLQMILTRTFTAEQCQPTQSCELAMSGSVSAVMQLIVRSLAELRFARDIAVSEKDGMITATTHSSLVSFGEVIAIKVTEMSKDQVRVKLSSAPAMKTTVLDYGKNYRNIEAIRGMLRSLGAQIGNSPRIPAPSSTE